MSASFDGFIGPSYVSQAPTVEAERCINWYPERIEAQNPKAGLALFPTPGVTSFASLAGSIGRGIWAQDGRAFAVIGSAVGELLSTQSFTILGGVAASPRIATMASSGVAGGELMIASGGNGYILDLTTRVLTQVLTGTCDRCAYLDGFFLALDTETSTLRISENLDGLTWTTTQLAQRSRGSDLFASMLVSGTDIWLFGTATSEVWYDAGVAPFPFIPNPTLVIPFGIAAPDSAALVDSAPTWLAQGPSGGYVVLRAAGAVPTRISTHALEYAFTHYPTVADAEGFGYQDQGHSFYVLTFPTAGQTWVWDSATGLWHERAEYVNGAYTFWRPRAHAFAFGQHLVMDRSSGTVWTLSTDVATDPTGSGIRRLRRAPHVSQQADYLFYRDFQIDMEVGLGLTSGQGSDPQAMLRWSVDGSLTWSNEHWTSVGAIGQYKRRVLWNRLGRARDRVFEVSVSDPIPWRLTGAYLTAEAGG